MRLIIPLALLLGAYGWYVARSDHRPQSQAEVMLDTRFEVRAGGTLIADVHDADVTVEPGGDAGAHVIISVRSRDLEWARDVYRRMGFEVRADGNDVRINGGDARISRDEWRRHRSGVGVHVLVRLPARYSVDVRSGDGDVGLGDLNGKIRIWTGDGDIHVGKLNGTIDLRTSDGDVNAESLESSETIQLETSDGDVIVRRLAGALNASTSDGDLTVELTTPANVRLRTHDGDITIFAAQGYGAEVELTGEDVYIARAFQFEGRQSERWARGKLNAGGPSLTASTSDGQITLNSRH